MIELIAVVTITLVAVISPGPDFAMVSRYGLLVSRRSGIYSAFGIGAGVLIHVAYTLVGIGILIQQSPWVFTVLKLFGAAYLIGLGITMLWHADGGQTTNAKNQRLISDGYALKTGFLTNVLNPKTTIFIVSLFMQVVNPQTPLSVQIFYGLFICIAHIAWFSLVALFFSSSSLNAQFLRFHQGIDRAFGCLLITFGCLLALASAQ